MHPWCDRDETRQVPFAVKDTKPRQFISASMSVCMASVSNQHRARSLPNQKYFTVLAMRSTERNYCKNLSRAQLFHPYEKETNSHVLQGMPPEKTNSHSLSPWTEERQILMEYFHVCLINANSCTERKKKSMTCKKLYKSPALCCCLLYGNGQYWILIENQWYQ